ncbi:flagellar hook-associated protein FlgL [Ferribacterium limneticum]|uniref:flagellar hook-associated protein FlgL n=1 Tax=Ferribacterium limneticum TaxID=76259 RepID=UPI001CFAD125|nr:flagellar hook-associated protein FlgL [Ferribacterium limneticum]UCV27663.1 flagellar hook-associated protein FlgL [Ferribacterium limneticum]UCV31580.1 flagellar hook-associated protein FlgL [Ferribacterium limneticum]
MSMRISTMQIYNGGTAGIQNLQSDLYSAQNQVSTGRRIVTPKDDPIGAAQALMVTQSSAVNELYLKNQGAADSKLSALDSTLQGINEELVNIYEKSIAAGNGAYSDSNRKAIAAELSERLDSLVSLANTQDGNGRYVFAGFQSTITPFTGSPVTYNGDDGQQKLQVTASQFVTTNLSGNDVFVNVVDSNGVSTGQSMFQSVQDMITFLNTPGGSAGSPLYTNALKNINASIDNVLRNQATVGARQSSLESMTNTAEDRSLQYAQQLSDIEDLDYAKAITEISQKKLQLEATQATFAKTAQLSLFSYI